MTGEKTVNIDGKEYKISDLTEKAMKLITQITLIGNKKNNLLQEMDILDKAGNAYAGLLKSEMKKKE